MNNEVQQKVIGIVEGYKKLFPDEYRAVILQVKENKKKQGKSKAESLDRALMEIPETLHAMLFNNLAAEEYQWLYGNDKKGHRWLAKHYKEFTLVENI